MLYFHTLSRSECENEAHPTVSSGLRRRRAYYPFHYSTREREHGQDQDKCLDFDSHHGSIHGQDGQHRDLGEHNVFSDHLLDIQYQHGYDL